MTALPKSPPSFRNCGDGKAGRGGWKANPHISRTLQLGGGRGGGEQIYLYTTVIKASFCYRSSCKAYATCLDIEDNLSDSLFSLIKRQWHHTPQQTRSEISSTPSHSMGNNPVGWMIQSWTMSTGLYLRIVPCRALYASHHSHSNLS